MSNTYKLQLRHGDENKNFITRDAVLDYINGQLQYGGVSLLPYEPVLFFYGEDDNKNAIIMVGLPEGKTQSGKSFFIIDTADLKESIESIDKNYDDAIKALQEEDKKISEVVNQEIEDRKAADKKEAKAREDKDIELETEIAEEVETLSKKDNELQEAIDFTKADLMSVINACGLIYNEKLAEDRVSYVPDTHNEVIRDAKDIAEAIDKISNFVIQLGNDLKLSVDNTDTVSLSLSANTKDGGNTLTADVNIAGAEGLSKKNYDNNIIGKTGEGLYACASIEPSAKNPNILIFKTSGYIDGQFKVDAFETEVQLTPYKGDNGKNTGITVSVDTDKNVISSELNIASDDTNILKLEDGEYIVEGTAKNIKYKDTNVFTALNNQSTRIEEIEDSIEFVKSFDVKGSETDSTSVSVDKTTKGDFTVSTDVKLSTDKSIIVSNGGLKANISATFKKGTSTLLIDVGNNEYAIDLSELAVSVLKTATYDADTEELVLEFIVGDTTKTVRIPVGTLIHDVEVDDTDTIDMTLRSVYGGPNHISADLKVDKTQSDNMLTVSSNGAYVSKAFITNAVKVETDERKAADKELESKIDETTKLANANKEAIATEATTARAAEKANADAIAQEIKDARAAEDANAKAIEKNANNIKENQTAISDEVTRATKAEQINATAITAEETRAKEAEVKNTNAIASEIDRAMEKEADLLEKIGDNTSKIKENTTAIETETERATKADNEIKAAVEATSTSVVTEVERAKAAENELASKISKNTEELASAKELATNVDKALETEVTRATAAEAANTTAIEAEKNRATTAEGEITSKVTKNTEDIAIAKQSVVEADKAIQIEVTRATAAESANSTAIETEVTRAKTAESDLLEKINKNADNIQTISTEVGNIELKKEGDLSYALYVNGTKHGELTIPQEQFLKSVNYDATTKELIFIFNTSTGEVTTKISIADLIDTYTAGSGLSLDGNVFSVNFAKVASVDLVANEVNAEKLRATAAESANTTAIETEKNRAEAKEGELAGNITSVQNDVAKAIDNISANKNAIDSEIVRAKGTETNNANNIANEATRAKEKEKELSEEIANNANEISSNKTAINDEVLRATTAEDNLKLSITKAESSITSVKENLESKINEEALRAKDAETAIQNQIETLSKNTEKSSSDLQLAKDELNAKIDKKANIADVYTKDEILTKFDDYALEADVKDSLNEKLNVTDAQNVYATKESLQDVKDTYATTETVNDLNSQATKRISDNEEAIDNFNLTYNAATSELIYTDKNGVSNTYKLYSGSLVKNGEFDTDSNSIVLTIENAGIESQITIPVSQLLSDVSEKIQGNTDSIQKINEALSKLAKDWEVKATSSVELTKTSGAEKDVLTAMVRVATSNKQAIQSTGEGLYVSNDLEDFTCVYGEDGTISAQTAISKLLTKTQNSDNEINNLNTDLTELKDQVKENTNALNKSTSDVSSLVDQVKENTANIANKANASDVYTKTEITEKLNDYVKSSNVYTKDEITTKLNDYAKTTDVYTKTEVDKTLSEYTKATEFQAKLDEKLSKTDAETTYATKDSVEETIKAFEQIKNYITNITEMFDKLKGSGIEDLAEEFAKIKKATGYDTYESEKNLPTRVEALEEEDTNIKTNLIGDKDNPTEGSVWYELNNIVDAGTF